MPKNCAANPALNSWFSAPCRRIFAQLPANFWNAMHPSAGSIRPTWLRQWFWFLDLFLADGIWQSSFQTKMEFAHSQPNVGTSFVEKSVSTKPTHTNLFRWTLMLRFNNGEGRKASQIPGPEGSGERWITTQGASSYLWEDENLNCTFDGCEFSFRNSCLVLCQFPGHQI